MLAPSLHVARLGVGAQSFFASCIKHVLTTWHSMIDLQEACVCLQAHVDTEQGHTKLVLAHEGPRPRRQLHSRVCACVCVCLGGMCCVVCNIQTSAGPFISSPSAALAPSRRVPIHHPAPFGREPRWCRALLHNTLQINAL